MFPTRKFILVLVIKSLLLYMQTDSVTIITVMHALSEVNNQERVRSIQEDCNDQFYNNISS